MNFTDSSNYYSTVKDQQSCVKQTNNSDAAYKVSKQPDIIGHFYMLSVSRMLYLIMSFHLALMVTRMIKNQITQIL